MCKANEEQQKKMRSDNHDDKRSKNPICGYGRVAEKKNIRE